MGIVWTIVIGFVVGLVARAVMPGDDKMGFIMTCVLGVVGALAATYAGQALGWYAAGQGAGFFASLAGALLLLVLWRFLKRRDT